MKTIVRLILHCLCGLLYGTVFALFAFHLMHMMCISQSITLVISVVIGIICASLLTILRNSIWSKIPHSLGKRQEILLLLLIAVWFVIVVLLMKPLYRLS